MCLSESSLSKSGAKSTVFEQQKQGSEMCGENTRSASPKVRAKKIVGYARVSTDKQTHDLQVDALRSWGVASDDIVVEVASGATSHLPKRDALLNSLSNGDTLVVYALDRLGRRALEVAQLAEKVSKEGVRLVVTTLQIDSSTTTGQMMLTVMAFLAQMERETLQERTRAGVAAARKRGKRLGRPPAMTPEEKQAAIELRRSQMTIREISELFNVSASTVKRAVNKKEGVVL